MTISSIAEAADPSCALSIIIVGAGISGLTAAVALRKAGHNVTVLEKSAFAAEVGAAVSLASNGARVLDALGFSFERARAVALRDLQTVDGATLVERSSVATAVDRFGFPLLSVHRVDFQRELMRLAGQEGLRTGTRVVSIHAEDGRVTLEGGEVLQADLVVAADGVHSAARPAVVQQLEGEPKRPLVSFRFLFPRDELLRVPGVKEVYEGKASKASVIIDPSVSPEHEQHLVWYSCRGGEIENFNALTSLYDGPILTDKNAAKDELLRRFSNLHPTLRNIFSAAQDVKMWPLIYRDPLSSWVRGKTILIGDAAHPMLPIGGQGANQAIEDGGALGLLLKGVGPSQLPERLRMFQDVRVKRAARTLLMSSVRSNREAEVAPKLRYWLDDPNMAIPRSLAGRIEHDYGFDLDKACKQKLQEMQS